uniref:Exported protein n=1 Tax=Parastrongyloides trichosuri TaxID=131310 RepID=A0A0N5A4X8_PARTI
MKKIIFVLFFLTLIINYCQGINIAKVEDDFILSNNLKSFSDDSLMYNDDGSVSLIEVIPNKEYQLIKPTEKFKLISIPITITNPLAYFYENMDYFFKKLHKRDDNKGLWNKVFGNNVINNY